jgi:hypothetical protein
MDSFCLFVYCCAWLLYLGRWIKNKRFSHFESELKAGNHLFFVDIESEKEQLLGDVISAHPQLVVAGEGPSVPHWFIRLQDRFKRFVKIMP